MVKLAPDSKSIVTHVTEFNCDYNIHVFKYSLEHDENVDRS